MRTRLITVTAACAVLAGLGQSVPALAQRALPAAGGPAFSHFAYSRVQVTGNVNPGAPGPTRTSTR